MIRGTAARVAAALAAVAVAAVVWIVWSGTDESAIRGELDDLAALANSSASDGLGTVARAAGFGTFFTENVVIDLGQGAAPIIGREMLIGMASRLQPRTAAFELEFADVTVHKTMENEADVDLTATFTRRSEGTAERSIDAREFALTMRKIGGRWRIATVRTVDTLR